MNKQEFQHFMTELDLLVHLKDKRTPTEINLWSRIIGNTDFEDACTARDQTFADGIRYPTPGDILSRIKTIRSHRIAVHGPVLPNVDPDDVSAFQSVRRAVTRQIAGVMPEVRSINASPRL